MSREEREARSRLVKLVHEVRFVRGAVSQKKRRCGQPTCHCARGEDLHVAVNLETSQDGGMARLHVPSDLWDTVREWSANYAEIRDLLETLSRIHWEKLRNRKV